MSTESQKPSRLDLRFVHWFVLIIALVMIGLGSWSITSQHYLGSTAKYGGVEVSLNGRPAVLVGLLYVSLGLLPLAVWFRTPHAAAWWGSFFGAAFFALLTVLLYF